MHHWQVYMDYDIPFFTKSDARLEVMKHIWRLCLILNSVCGYFRRLRGSRRQNGSPQDYPRASIPQNFHRLDDAGLHSHARTSSLDAFSLAHVRRSGPSCPASTHVKLWAPCCGASGATWPEAHLSRWAQQVACLQPLTRLESASRSRSSCPCDRPTLEQRLAAIRRH